jgi:hypothetical protein
MTLPAIPIGFGEARGKFSEGEGLVLLGTGGDIQEWITGVTKLLKEEKIAGSDDPEEVWAGAYVLTTTGGRTDLLLLFKEQSGLNMGKMAMWRLRFGDASWWSDYTVNYAPQHGFPGHDESNEDGEGEE